MLPEWCEVQPTRQAEKGLRACLPRVMRSLAALEQEPFKGHPRTGSLREVRSLVFSPPGGAHRAAYLVPAEGRACLAFAIGAHETFHPETERRCRASQGAGEVSSLAQ
jgi:hypothetical protein